MFFNRKVAWLLIASILLSVLGCTENEVEFNRRQYIIENDTNVSLNINFYNKTNDLVIDELSGNLESTGMVLNNTIEQTSNFNNITVPYVGADSVKIILNENKFLTYTYSLDNNEFSEPINRNMFRHSNYENLGNEQYLFKITQEDYENAEDCNGNNCN